MSPGMLTEIVPEPDGVVRIGSPPLAASYVAQVALPGVTLLVDPSDLDPAQHAVVYDTEQAGDLLNVLFGSAVSNAVLAGVPAEVPTADSPELLAAEDLGRLLWLDEFRPVPLDFALLKLETVVARAEFPEDEPLIELPEHTASLVELARRLRENPALPLARELGTLFREALQFLPIVDPDHPELAHERELLRARDLWGSAAVDPADLAWLAAQMTPAPATHLGGGLELSGTAALDWRRVPPVLLPATESSIRFDVAGGRVDVAVDAPARSQPHPAVRELAPPPLPVLIASLRSSAWPLPLAEGGVSFDAARNQWVGSFTIGPKAMELASAAPVLDVDIRATAGSWAAPNQRQARAAAARRWAARGIEARRLAVEASDGRLDQAGGGALRFAARLWGAAERPDRAERCRAMAVAEPGGVRLGLAERWLQYNGEQLPS